VLQVGKLTKAKALFLCRTVLRRVIWREKKKRTFSFFLFPGPRAQIEIIPLSWPDWWWGKGLDSVQKEGEGKRNEKGKRKIS
jgi:hypothetical protein